MPPTQADETLEQTPDTNDDLRSALESAFDEQIEADEQSATEATEGDDGQPRDERGRWTKAQREHYEEQERQRAEAGETGEEEEPQQEQELRLAPPFGWSPAAKAAYANLPPEVQEAVARREMEVNNGFRKLQDYKGLEQYAEVARNSGTTLKEALDRYKAAEDALEQDFFGGTMQLCEMYGIHPVQLAQGIMRQYGVGMPSQGQPRDPQSALLAQRLHGIEEVVRTLKTERERQEYEQERQMQESINAHLDQFRNEHVYFDNVRQHMGHLIKEGVAESLEDAYEMAIWAHPEIRPLLIKEQAAPNTNADRVARARRASGSLSPGAPAGTKPTGSSSTSIRGTLEEAWDASL